MDSLLADQGAAVVSVASDSTSSALLAKYSTTEQLAVLTWVWCGVIVALFIAAVLWHLARNVGGKQRMFAAARRRLSKTAAPGGFPPASYLPRMPARIRSHEMRTSLQGGTYT